MVGHVLQSGRRTLVEMLAHCGIIYFGQMRLQSTSLILGYPDGKIICHKPEGEVLFDLS